MVLSPACTALVYGYCVNDVSIKYLPLTVAPDPPALQRLARYHGPERRPPHPGRRFRCGAPCLDTTSVRPTPEAPAPHSALCGGGPGWQGLGSPYKRLRLHPQRRLPRRPSTLLTTRSSARLFSQSVRRRTRPFRLLQSLAERRIRARQNAEPQPEPVPRPAQPEPLPEPIPAPPAPVPRPPVFNAMAKVYQHPPAFYVPCQLACTNPACNNRCGRVNDPRRPNSHRHHLCNACHRNGWRG